LAKRSIAAASPPRICGPEERVIQAYQPATAAASSSSEPAVTTPAPPLPLITSETLGELLDTANPLDLFIAMAS
jgi:hypothetical protein